MTGFFCKNNYISYITPLKFSLVRETDTKISWAIFKYFRYLMTKTLILPNCQVPNGLFIYKCTLYNVILRIGRNFLETRENIKILTHPSYHINLDWFWLEWSKNKMADSKKLRFSKSPILKKNLWKFHRLVLGLVGFIDAKGIDVAQPTWPWGCLT